MAFCVLCICHHFEKKDMCVFPCTAFHIIPVHGQSFETLDCKPSPGLLLCTTCTAVKYVHACPVHLGRIISQLHRAAKFSKETVELPVEGSM